jgi:hypothetical protein
MAHPPPGRGGFCLLKGHLVQVGCHQQGQCDYCVLLEMAGGGGVYGVK